MCDDKNLTYNKKLHFKATDFAKDHVFYSAFTNSLPTISLTFLSFVPLLFSFQFHLKHL